MDLVTRGRLKLLLVLGLFIGPLLVAFLWYYGLGGVLAPSGKTNHGNLVQPVVSLKDFEDHLSDSSPFTLDGLKHKWTIVHVASVTCGEDCQRSLYNTRQTRVAVGKDANRIQRILLLDDDTSADEIKENHVDMKIITLQSSKLMEQLAPVVKSMNAGPHDALIVDPLGNVMMVIPLELDPRLLLKDLKKLLKLSRVG